MQEMYITDLARIICWSFCCFIPNGFTAPNWSI